MVIFCLARIDLGDFTWLSGFTSFMMFLSLVQSTVGTGWPALGVFLGQHGYDAGLMDDEKNRSTCEKWMKVMMCHDVLISVEKWILLSGEFMWNFLCDAIPDCFIQFHVYLFTDCRLMPAFIHDLLLLTCFRFLFFHEAQERSCQVVKSLVWHSPQSHAQSMLPTL